MEFTIKSFRPNNDKYTSDEIDKVYHFSKLALKEFGKFLKAIVLFGSLAKNKDTENSDVDILVIVDDVTVIMSPELASAYELLTKKISQKVADNIHVTTFSLSAFWDFCKKGDPIIVNILRDGLVLFDTGFFSPMQKLLFMGKIKPTEESIWSYYSRAPKTLANSKYHIMRAFSDLYWACIDSAHAALMRQGYIPPSPDHMADMIKEAFVEKNILDKRYEKLFREIYKIEKMIEHGEIAIIKGHEYDKYYHEVESFVKEMERIIKRNYKMSGKS